MINVITNIVASRLSGNDYRTYEASWREALIRISGFPIFGDTQYDGIKWNNDKCQYYENINLYNVNNWVLEPGEISYIKHDEDDNAPLTTLYYIISNFLLPRGINVSGDVVVYSKKGDEYKVVSYKISNLKFIYKVNESIELTRHWKNCNQYYLGQAVNDTHYPSCPLSLNPNPFINFINNFSLYNSEDFIPDEIFEDTFNYLI
jgi:hypothetical protein